MLSGKTATLKADLEEEVLDLKRRAETALQVGPGKLLNPSGGVLDARAPIKCARLQDGDSLMLHISTAQVQACSTSFAAILGDGSVENYGNSVDSAMKDQLKTVQAVQI